MQSLKCDDKIVSLSFGTLVMTVIFAFLLVIATFTQIKFNFSWAGWGTYSYVPQIPIVMLIAIVLGPRFGLMSILLYVVAGLFLPIYALGGGIHYILEYSFGYILAYLPAVYIAGKIIERGYTIRNIMLSVVFCVFTIHIIGTFYLMLVVLIKNDPMYYIYDFLVLQSGVKIIFDLIFTIAAALIAQPIKQVLWITMS